MLAFSLVLACLPQGASNSPPPEPIDWDDARVRTLTAALWAPDQQWDIAQTLIQTAHSTSCPSLDADGVTLRGDCTDRAGTHWQGQATVKPEQVVFEDWGRTDLGVSTGEILWTHPALDSDFVYSSAGSDLAARISGMLSVFDNDGVGLGMQGWVTLGELSGVSVQGGLSDCEGGQVLEYDVSYAVFGHADPLTVTHDGCTDQGTWSDAIHSGTFTLE